MKFLVFGCNGMAGHLISLYLKEQGHDVLGFARQRSLYVPSVTGSVQDTGLVAETIREGRFDSVINCVGILNQFAEQEKAQAVFLNAYFPHFLADVTEGSSTQVIHMSTDCVFSGRRGGYSEDDLRDGESFYDRSKALGELEDGKNITLRCSIVGPDIKPAGIGLLNWFMQQRGEVNGYTKAMWTGQTTLQLAKTMEAAAKEKAHGLYNVVPDYAISKYELLQLFNKYMRSGSMKIHAVEGIIVNKSLKRTRRSFKPVIPSYETMIEELAEWMRAHRTLYPQYEGR